MVGARRTLHRERAGSIPAPRRSGAAPASSAPDPSGVMADLDALREREPAAFAALVRALHPSMVRVAGTYVSSREVAEEVAQETWVAVLEGLDRFEGRSSLKTWIFRILVNRATTRGQRESRCLPFSSVAPDGAGDEHAGEPDRLLSADRPRWPGRWAASPIALPED